jgi:hypothetical protein
MLDNIRQIAKIVFIAAIIWTIVGKIKHTSMECDCDSRITHYRLSKLDTLPCNVQPFNLGHPALQVVSLRGQKYNIAIDDLVSVEIKNQSGYLECIVNIDGKREKIRLDKSLKKIKQELCQSCKASNHPPDKHFIFYKWGIINYGYVHHFIKRKKKIFLDDGTEITISENCVDDVVHTILCH